MNKMIDYSTAIDWLSFKLTGVSVLLAAITGGQLLTVMAGIATSTTIIYNVIRIYKELNKKQ
jgi:divalent metal cation (Fe/Co/Zn/Cd) transporter